MAGDPAGKTQRKPTAGGCGKRVAASVGAGWLIFGTISLVATAYGLIEHGDRALAWLQTQEYAGVLLASASAATFSVVAIYVLAHHHNDVRNAPRALPEKDRGERRRHHLWLVVALSLSYGATAAFCPVPLDGVGRIGAVACTTLLAGAAVVVASRWVLNEPDGIEFSLKRDAVAAVSVVMVCLAAAFDMAFAVNAQPSTPSNSSVTSSSSSSSTPSSGDGSPGRSSATIESDDYDAGCVIKVAAGVDDPERRALIRKIEQSYWDRTGCPTGVVRATADGTLVQPLARGWITAAVSGQAAIVGDAQFQRLLLGPNGDNGQTIEAFEFAPWGGFPEEVRWCGPGEFLPLVSNDARTKGVVASAVVTPDRGVTDTVYGVPPDLFRAWTADGVRSTRPLAMPDSEPSSLLGRHQRFGRVDIGPSRSNPRVTVRGLVKLCGN